MREEDFVYRCQITCNLYMYSLSLSLSLSLSRWKVWRFTNISVSARKLAENMVFFHVTLYAGLAKRIVYMDGVWLLQDNSYVF